MSTPSCTRVMAHGILVALLFFVVDVADAQDGDLPARLSYQGQLLTGGVPANGTQVFTFTLRTEGGAEVWQQEQSVDVQNGVFSTILGEQSGNDSLAEVFQEHGVLFLSVATGGEEVDEIELTATPYALRAGWADEVAEDGAVRALNGMTGSLALATSGLLGISEDDDTITLSVDEEDLVRTLAVAGDNEALTGDIALRGEGNVIITRDGQEIVIRSVIISSERYKQDVRPLSDALALVQQLEGVEFSWKQDGREDMGLIAEDVAAILPQVVAYDESGESIEGLYYHGLVGLLVEAIKEQQQAISSLEERLDRLERTLEKE